MNSILSNQENPQNDLVLWKSEYCIGIPEIDKQHQTLLKLINNLAGGVNNGFTEAELLLLFSELTEYTHFHFEAEQKYLHALNEDDFSLHLLQHKHFTEYLKSIDLKKGNAMNLLFYLSDWLVNHILIEDKKIVTALHKE